MNSVCTSAILIFFCADPRFPTTNCNVLQNQRSPQRIPSRFPGDLALTSDSEGQSRWSGQYRETFGYTWPDSGVSDGTFGMHIWDHVTDQCHWWTVEWGGRGMIYCDVPRSGDEVIQCTHQYMEIPTWSHAIQLACNIFLEFSMLTPNKWNCPRSSHLDIFFEYYLSIMYVNTAI